MHPFVAHDRGIAVQLDNAELALLQSLLGQLLELVEDPVPHTSQDASLNELMSIVGFDWDAPVPEPPRDPALARLLPSGSHDPEDSYDFRKFTEGGLRRKKRENALAASKALAGAVKHSEELTRAASEASKGGRRIRLRSLRNSETAYVISHPSAIALMTALNDVRLIMATRLGLTEDEDLTALREKGDFSDEDLNTMVQVYDLITWWQQSLVESLIPTLPPPRRDNE